MKRDMELIRKLLLYYEENLTPGNPISLDQAIIAGYSSENINYNIETMYKGGLVEGNMINAMGVTIQGFVTDITWEGHEFLDSIKNDGVWRKVKEQIKPLGDVSFDVLKAVATAATLKALGIGG